MLRTRHARKASRSNHADTAAHSWATTTAASTAGAVGRARAVAANGANRTSVFRELAKQAALQGTTVGRAYESARNYNFGNGSGYNGGDRPKTTEEAQREYREAQQRDKENYREHCKKVGEWGNKYFSQFKNK
mgnify:CR=1 FL=1